MLRPAGNLVGVNCDEIDDSDVQETDVQINEEKDFETDFETETLDLEEAVTEASAEEVVTEASADELVDFNESSAFLLIDTKKVFKANIVKEIMGNGYNPKSFDRLKRVRGYTKFEGEKKNHDEAPESALFVGDPVAFLIVVEKNLQVLGVGVVAKISQSKKNFGHVNLEGLAASNLEIAIVRLQYEEHENKWKMTGNFGKVVKLSGDEVTCLNPDVVHDKTSGSSLFVFDHEKLLALADRFENLQTQTTQKKSRKSTTFSAGGWVPTHPLLQGFVLSLEEKTYRKHFFHGWNFPRFSLVYLISIHLSYKKHEETKTERKKERHCLSVGNKTILLEWSIHWFSSLDLQKVSSIIKKQKITDKFRGENSFHFFFCYEK
eukprot:Pompholyxophrys_punicea_v1_NODE_36_length_4801_cov_3.930257.p1 type:complete len:377 gc:universal NODE_36_length_4801_cov_3.930257:3294-4424(+)